ncbi:uncharacterized protein LOC106081444 isoform X2 [Stomoxys calcitrans]|uniref:Uncharacterized protein n=1 Tax=Stomoxys calcitrans TaxID=35570 RepID=A0A1I8P181_STOCA|nr:uncharacterized protein LOC106081444 isoform X2 [Stomoxys calcitrans]XP_013098837.1 uncharacterized protein LOC106081444 isoform X2 [Stomoxys calcitrans]
MLHVEVAIPVEFHRNMCRKFARNSVQIPKEKFASSQMCSYCGCFWNESEFQMRLKSKHVTMKAKTKRLIEQLNRSNKEDGQLSGKQRKRAKWLQKRATQYMEMKCEQCGHKSKIKMEKPKKKSKATAAESNSKANNSAAEQEDVIAIEEDIKTKTTKKKKKNKNKLAGLKLPLEGKQDKQQTHKPNIIKTPPQNPMPLPIAKTQAPKTITPNLQSQKSKKKKKTSSNITPTISKTVSKTQQQNSLLQLAALLKQSSSSSDGKSSTQKRLESLLK